MDAWGLKVFGYFSAASIQAVVLIVAGFKLVPFLEQEYPISVEWFYIVWPTAILTIFHTYYVVVKLILKIEKNRKKR